MSAGRDHGCGLGRRPEPERVARALRAPLLEVFPPALLGRLITVPYYPLSDAVMGDIIRLQLERIAARIAEQHEAASAMTGGG